MKRQTHELLITDGATFDRLMDEHPALTDEGLDLMCSRMNGSTRFTPSTPARSQPPAAPGHLGAPRMRIVDAQLLRDALRLRDLERMSRMWQTYDADERGAFDREAEEIEGQLRKAVG